MSTTLDNPWAEVAEPTDHPIHPHASLFPMMDEAALRELADDITKNGLLRPIELVGGAIIDGRNRLAACRLVGRPPTFIDVDDIVAERGTLAYVVTSNLARRHLTIGQRAVLGAKLLPLFAEEARRRQEASRAKPGQRVGQEAAPPAGALFGGPSAVAEPLCPKGCGPMTRKPKGLACTRCGHWLENGVSPSAAKPTTEPPPVCLVDEHGQSACGIGPEMIAREALLTTTIENRATCLACREALERQDLVAQLDEQVRAPVPAPSEGRARDAAAAAVGVSARSVEHASRVVDQGAPELAEAVEAGKVDLTSAATLAGLDKAAQVAVLATADPAAIKAAAKGIKDKEKAAREEKERDRRAKLAAQADLTAPAMDRVDLRCESAAQMLSRLALADRPRVAAVIHADPPWTFDDPGIRGGVQTRYPTMSGGDIQEDLARALDVATDDAYLLLWVPSSMLDQLVDVTPRWEQLGVLVWAKSDGPGTGTHVRNEHELCVVYGVADGKSRPFIQGGPRSIVSAPRGEHSEKPQEALRAWIGAYSAPGAVVVDLYAGERAAVARACLAEGRRFVGAEIDPERHARSTAELSTTTPLFPQGGVGDE